MSKAVRVQLGTTVQDAPTLGKVGEQGRKALLLEMHILDSY